MKIKMVNTSNNPNPEYSREGDSGLDLRAFTEHPIVLLPHRRVIVSTGISMEIPIGYEGQVRGRSGLAINNGVTVLGTGTVDSNYRGDIGVILTNQGSEQFTIENGMRIGQLVISKVETVKLDICDNLDETVRGSDGFGSSGLK